MIEAKISKHLLSLLHLNIWNTQINSGKVFIAIQAILRFSYLLLGAGMKVVAHEFLQHQAHILPLTVASLPLTGIFSLVLSDGKPSNVTPFWKMRQCVEPPK